MALSFSASLILSGKNKIKMNTVLRSCRGHRERRLIEFGNIDRLRSPGSCQLSALVGTKASANFSGIFSTGFEIEEGLKDLAILVSKLLNGRNVNLVGMMGAGKTTLGKILAALLLYDFVDSDDYIENMVGKSIPEIFEENGETHFRYFEIEALRRLSSVPRQVVSSGGRSVLNRANREYMKQGVSVFLDVPLHTLALRIQKDDGRRRPIVESKRMTVQKDEPVLGKLLKLYKRRKAAYANAADINISLLAIAEKWSIGDVSDVSTTVIALEVLTAIESFLQSQNNKSPSFHVFPGH